MCIANSQRFHWIVQLHSLVYDTGWTLKSSSLKWQFSHQLWAVNSLVYQISIRTVRQIIGLVSLKRVCCCFAVLQYCMAGSHCLCGFMMMIQADICGDPDVCGKIHQHVVHPHCWIILPLDYAEQLCYHKVSVHSHIKKTLWYYLMQVCTKKVKVIKQLLLLFCWSFFDGFCKLCSMSSWQLYGVKMFHSNGLWHNYTLHWHYFHRTFVCGLETM